MFAELRAQGLADFLAAAPSLEAAPRHRKPRKLTLADAVKQAAKLGLTLTSFETRPDGSTVSTVASTSDPPEANPWLADLKDKGPSNEPP